MEITEFIAKRKELKKLIGDKKHELAKLRYDYINEHCPYKAGDKVKVETPEYVSNHCGNRGEIIPAQTQFGIIGPQTIDILEDGSFRPTIYAIKKDGTKSTRYVYTPYEVQSIITKID